MDRRRLAFYLIIGVAIGTAFGVANDDVGFYSSAGAALGLVFGYMRSRKPKPE